MYNCWLLSVCTHNLEKFCNLMLAEFVSILLACSQLHCSGQEFFFLRKVMMMYLWVHFSNVMYTYAARSKFWKQTYRSGGQIPLPEVACGPGFPKISFSQISWKHVKACDSSERLSVRTSLLSKVLFQQMFTGQWSAQWLSRHVAKILICGAFIY